MLITAFYLLLFLHLGLAVEVLQPAEVISDQGDNVTLECKLGQRFMTYHTMFWYHQKHRGARIEFILKEFQEKVGRFRSFVHHDSNYFALGVSGLLVNDSSTYHCAARHSDADKPRPRANSGPVSPDV